MRIERVICDRCGFEQQEDDFTDDAWDGRFKGDICRECATNTKPPTAGAERVDE